MAGSFQPKFIDLVRNYTTTVGTGDFTLGPAVNGFASFTAACQVGDSFYYSALGVDKPAETEVGRGTLLADGVISREPIGGVATSFSSGTKSIALVAAAEWFEAAHQLVGSATPAIADRTALASHSGTPSAYLCEAGREGTFVFDTSDLSELVSADSVQGVYVAAAADPTGASGAWVRKFDGAVNARWFGLTSGDDPTNGPANTAGWNALQATLGARTAPYPITTINAIERVLLPSGIYWFSDSGSGAAIDISHTVVLEGQAGSYGANCVPVLKFPSGVTGIRVQGPQTSGATTKDSVIHAGASGTVIRNIALCGAFTGAEAEAHGIQLRAAATIEHVSIASFEGDAVHISASLAAADGGDPPYGNASTSMLYHVTANGCRDGIAIRGSDVNACTIVSASCNSNRRWGISDRSFLGNSYFGGQLASNGITSSNDGLIAGASVVSHNGNRYGVIAGQEAGASTNSPSGTTADNSWWYYLAAGAAGGGIPDWFSGISCRAGGALFADSNNARNLFSGVYYEDGQGLAQTVWPSLVVSGKLASIGCWKGSTGASVSVNSLGQLSSTRGFDSAVGGYRINGVNVIDSIRNFMPASIASSGAIKTTAGGIGYSAGAGGTAVQATSKSTAVTLNSLCGEITMNAAQLGAAAGVSFALNNSQIAAHDAMVLNIVGGAADFGKYVGNAAITGDGSATISVRNVGAVPLSEALVLRFAIVKAVNA